MTAGPVEAPSSREQKRLERIERRRAQILRAAAQIMLRTGYHEMSMQAVADGAGMSVGLIYSYFASKEDVLQAVVVEILDTFRAQLAPAMEAAGEDPEEQIRAGFATFCRIIDQRREGTLLAYRESQTLPKDGRATIIRLEQETMEPLRAAVATGVDQGRLRPVPPELVAHNLKMAAHAWALKHWDLSRHFTLDEYIEAQLDLTLCAIRRSSGPSWRVTSPH